MTRTEYIGGLITGVFLGVLGMKLIKLFGDDEDAEAEINGLHDIFPENDSERFEPLKEAFLSHALLTIYPHKTHPSYYLYNGKFLPPFSDKCDLYDYCRYMGSIHRPGIYKFLRRNIRSDEEQQKFFDSYWSVIHGPGPVNEANAPEKLAGKEPVDEDNWF